MRRIISSLSFVLIFLCAGILPGVEEYDPLSVYLTWRQQPDTTMVIKWITAMDRKDDLVEYHLEGEEKWTQQIGTHTPLSARTTYFIHHVELTDLKPDSTYFFRISTEGKVFKFRTMPSVLKQPIRFVSGGDMYRDSFEKYVKTNLQAAKTSPMFAVLGGDIAYTGRIFSFLPEDIRRWLNWLIGWKKTMVTPEGYLIPIIAAIGNHETNGRYEQLPEQAPFFYLLFRMPQEKGYKVLDFGNYLSLIILDSNHTHPIEGNQALWLQNTLKERQAIPYKVAAYHVPAYPSCGKYTYPVSTSIRKNWVPLFEQYGVNVAFEHHAHTYKRSYRIKEEKISEDGVLYLGDGAWGVGNVRKPASPEERWYLAKTASANHFILTTIEDSKLTFQAIDPSGTIFDSFILEPSKVMPAPK